ncbi:uncharacterized protein METZ01_LOCUS191921, partial [marine metagenome]
VSLFVWTNSTVSLWLPVNIFGRRSGKYLPSTSYSETEPAEIVAGDRVAWKRTDLRTDYDPRYHHKEGS